MNEVCLLLIYILLFCLDLIEGSAEELLVWVICGIIGFVNVFDFTLLIILKSGECRKKCRLRRQEKKEFEERKKRMVPN